MADAAPTTPTGTSSTPVSSTPAGEGQSTPVAAAATTDASQTITPTTVAQPTSSDAAPGPDATQGATPTAAAPLFTIPETVKLAPEAAQKFEQFLRTKLNADGKVTLTSQEVLDQFLEQAQDANARWAKQVEDKDKANEAICKQRFTPTQLSNSETAVGFFSSFDPQFRDFAKRQLNDPVFVNAMRNIGERLSEDTFEIGHTPPPPPSKKSAAERMGYTKKPN